MLASMAGASEEIETRVLCICFLKRWFVHSKIVSFILTLLTIQLGYLIANSLQAIGQYRNGMILDIVASEQKPIG